MGNLTKLLEPSRTTQAIYAHWKRTSEAKQYDTVTLGASQVGRPCERALWYSFRHCCRPEFDGRMYRLFERGNLEEPRVVKDLRAIGCVVHEVDESTGKQFRVTALGGHLSGRLDGAVLKVPEAPKTWHVLEIKTHSAKSFKALVSKGVEEAKPEHFAQVMLYMHLTGMKRALYIAVNKDTEELYTERIRHSKDTAELLVERARRVIFSQAPPDRISDRPDYYLCKWCDARDICFGTEAPEPALPVPALSCRQCCHATPTNDGGGRWVCELHKKGLSTNDQKRPCESHLIIPDLLAAHESIECDHDAAGNYFIRFRHDKWGQWVHGKGESTWSSDELRSLPISLLGNDTLVTVKERFGGTAKVGYGSLTEKYELHHTKKSRIVWGGPLNFQAITEAWNAIYADRLEQLTPSVREHSEDGKAILAEYADDRLVVAHPASDRAAIWELKQ